MPRDTQLSGRHYQGRPRVTPDMQRDLKQLEFAITWLRRLQAQAVHPDHRDKTIHETFDKVKPRAAGFEELETALARLKTEFRRADKTP